MQSDKDKEQQPGQPPQQDAGGGMTPPPPPPKKKKDLFGMKGPKKPRASKSKQPKPPKPPREKKMKPPREKKVKTPRQKKVKAPKPPKGPRKPLFSFGKKKSKQMPAPYTPPVVPPSGETGAAAGGPPAAAESASMAKPEKKPKAERVKKTKAGREKKPKAERVKKTKAERVKKTKAGRVKKTKAPRAKKTRSAGGGFGGSKMSPVGLDLGRSSMTAVRLRYQTGGSILLQAANDTLPEGLIQEGEVRDVEALSFAIKEFWNTHNIKGKKVALGLANQKVVVRTLEFPLLDPKELRSAIEFQAQDYIPIPIEEAVFDFHVLGRFTDEEGIEKQKVLVVAAQKVMVMDFINAIKGAKLTIAGVDLQAFSLIRALAPMSFLDQGPGDRATAIANIGSDVTNLVVDMGGEPQFTRIISFGGDDFTKALQDLQGISFIKAEQLKAETGLSEPASRIEPEINEGLPEAGLGAVSPVEPAAGGPGESEEGPWPAGPPVEAETEQEMKTNVQRTLESVADSLAEEIRRSLDYYMSQEQSASIGKLLISGGGAMLKHLDAHLAQLFPFEVETGNPMMRIGENKSDLTDEQTQALAPQLTIAIGLSLEDEG